VDNDRESLIIEDLSKDDLTKDMSVTKSIGGGTLLGVPISYGDGSNYGTLCAIDNKPRKFNEVEVQLFQTMATLLGYVIDLDEAKNHIQSFSTPMVPIDEGVVILPLVGEMDEVRSKVILEQVLAKSYQESIDYFIIDISGLVIDNGLVSENIFKLTQSLKLLGALPILTGVRPDQAMNFQKSGSEMLQLTSKTSLKEALKWIGYRLVRS
jgi:rsbT co-antagonist protein RsbR